MNPWGNTKYNIRRMDRQQSVCLALRSSPEMMKTPVFCTFPNLYNHSKCVYKGNWGNPESRGKGFQRSRSLLSVANKSRRSSLAERRYPDPLEPNRHTCLRLLYLSANANHANHESSIL